MGDGAGPVIGVSKGFDAGAKVGELTPEVDGAGPDDFSDVFGSSNVDDFDFRRLIVGGWRRRGEKKIFDGVSNEERKSQKD